MISNQTVFLFTRFGLGHGPDDLQQTLAVKFLALTIASGQLPARILFYTDGVRLACAGSPVLAELQKMQAAGVDLLLCQTCLDRLGLADQVQVGIVGGMPDIIEAIQRADKVVSL